jgi:hypothetical protein
MLAIFGGNLNPCGFEPVEHAEDGQIFPCARILAIFGVLNPLEAAPAVASAEDVQG